MSDFENESPDSKLSSKQLLDRGNTKVMTPDSRRALWIRNTLVIPPMNVLDNQQADDKAE